MRVKWPLPPIKAIASSTDPWIEAERKPRLGQLATIPGKNGAMASVCTYQNYHCPAKINQPVVIDIITRGMRSHRDQALQPHSLLYVARTASIIGGSWKESHRSNSIAIPLQLGGQSSLHKACKGLKDQSRGESQGFQTAHETPLFIMHA